MIKRGVLGPSLATLLMTTSGLAGCNSDSTGDTMDDGSNETTDDGGDGDSGSESESGGDGDGGTSGDGDGDGDSQVDVNGSCLADADCGPAYHCVLGLCKEGCLTAEQCNAGEECTPHGECREPDAAEEDPFEEEGSASILQTITEWSEDQTHLTFTLRNQSQKEMDFRLSSLHAALSPDEPLGVVEPMGEIEISVPIDSALVDQATDRFVVMEVITEVESLDVRLVVPPTPTGNYSGVLAFNNSSLLGMYRINIDLTFDPSTGAVEGWLFPDDSVMWPNQVKAQGTYDPATGDFELRIVDLIPATYPGAGDIDPQPGPLGRQIGRDVQLTGKFSDDGTIIEGTLEETLSGLTSTAILLEGSFRLDHQTGDLRDPSAPGTFLGGFVPVSLPAEEWPSGLDEISIGGTIKDVCDDLGSVYGVNGTMVDGTLAEGSILFDETAAERILACQTCGANGAGCDPSTADTPTQAAQLAQTAAICAAGLVDSGYNVPQVIDNSATTPNSGPIVPGKWDWTQCTDQTSGPYNATLETTGRTCIDPAALACAGRLFRQALAEDTSEDQTEPTWVNEVLNQHLKQMSKEVGAAHLIATEEQIQAAFAYTTVGQGQVAAEELRRVRDEARRLLDRSAMITSAPGYTHVLQALGYSTVVDPYVEDDNPWGRGGADVNLAMVSAAKAADSMALQMRLMVAAELTDANRPMMRDLLNYAAAWNHAQSAMWFSTLDYWGVSDVWDELSFFGETAAELFVAHDQLKDGRNQFGYDPNWVPIKLTASVADETTNFEIVWDDALFVVENFFDRLNAADEALQAYDNNSFQVATESARISNDYDERLGNLCGFDGEGNPDLSNCGSSASDINTYLLEAQAAALVVKNARRQLANNHQLIQEEEDRIRKIIQNEMALQAFIADAQGEIFKIGDQATADISAQEAALVDRQCAAEYENAGVEAAVVAAEGIAEAALAMGELPPNAGGAAAAGTLAVAKAAAEFGKAALSCDLMKDEAKIGDRIAAIEDAAATEITIINQAIEDAMRDAGLEEKVINSEFTVAKLSLESLTLGIQVEQAIKAEEIAYANLGQAIQQVAALVKRRDRALALIQDENPLNPMANPRFLQARLELGKDVLARRLRALREGYTAGRALEYHINADVPQIETMLVSARSEAEIQDFMDCSMTIFNDYKLTPGASPYDKEISLREDIFGLVDPVLDSATGYLNQPEELFHELLAHPDHVLPDGSLSFAVALPLQGDSLFSSAICDDRLDTVEVMVEGDQIGDEDLLVTIERRGQSNLRRCENGLPSAAALTAYDLGVGNAAIQAGANTWDSGQPNGSFTDWPTSGEQWILTIPRDPSVAPQNQDVNFSTITDIKLRLVRRGRPLSGAFNPSCN